MADTRVQAIFGTIGIWLSYALAQYYEVEHVLVLGRVPSGRGGEIILNEARRVLGGRV